MTERKKTKRKVNLVSSHSDNERENCPLAGRNTVQVSAVSDLYKNDSIPSHFMRYLPRAGETVVYEEIFIPDVA